MVHMIGGEHLHQGGLPACKNHPQSVFSPHLPQALPPKVHLVLWLLASTSVIQDLSPPLISQTKTTHSSHKNQITEYLQHDDLITEGLQMLQKPVFKPRQNPGVVITEYP